MRVFILSVVAIIVITAIAAVVLPRFGVSTAEQFQIRENVRL